RLAAVLARLDLFLARLRFGLARVELACVRALGIAAAGDEGAEFADPFEHRRPALVARFADFDPLLEIDHLLARPREILLEFLVEARERVRVGGLALFDLPEIVLEVP